VPIHVWEHYLRSKPGSNELWFIPDANHYLQNDRPEAFAEVVLHALARTEPATPGPVSQAPGAAIRVDQSSPGLPEPEASFAL
jgi:hypothetical protein